MEKESFPFDPRPFSAQSSMDETLLSFAIKEFDKVLPPKEIIQLDNELEEEEEKQ